MNQIDRRLDALEAHLRPWALPNLQEELEWLSTPALLTALWDIATHRAERRWCSTHNHPMFNAEDPSRFLNIHWHGWYPHTGDQERQEWTLREIDDLDRRLTVAGYPIAAPVLFAIVESWCGDEDGLASHWRPERYDCFQDRLSGHRARLDQARNDGSAIAQEWRRQHPSWQPGMDDATALAFDMALMQEGLA